MRAWAALRRDPAFWVGATLVGLVVAASLAAPLIAPHDPDHAYRELMPLDGSALPPSATFPLGTDPDGHDYLSRLLYAGRATLLIGVGANFLAILLGTVVGLVAGYAGTLRIPLPGGHQLPVPVEGPLMRITDAALGFPALLLAIAASAVLGRSLGLVALLIAAVLWTTTARLVYGRVRTLRSAEFVAAGRALGSDTRTILRRHLLPFVLPLLPGLAIALTVLAFTLLGEAARDAAEPRAGVVR